jgi:hypothetical protein
LSPSSDYGAETEDSKTFAAERKKQAPAEKQLIGNFQGFWHQSKQL